MEEMKKQQLLNDLKDLVQLEIKARDMYHSYEEAIGQGEGIKDKLEIIKQQEELHIRLANEMLELAKKL